MVAVPPNGRSTPRDLSLCPSNASSYPSISTPYPRSSAIMRVRSGGNPKVSYNLNTSPPEITGAGDVPAANRGATSPNLSIPPSIVPRKRSSSALTARTMFSRRATSPGYASPISSITRSATLASVGSRLPSSHACRTPRRRILRST